MAWRVLVGAVLIAASVAGCSGKLTRGLAVQEVVVVFSAHSTAADHEAVLRACTGIPGTSPEPLPGRHAPLASRVYGVRFRVDYASNRELARLYSCLAGQRPRGVVSYTLETSGPGY